MTEIWNWGGSAAGILALAKGAYDFYRARSDSRRLDTKVNADAAEKLVKTAAESNAEYAEDLREVMSELREVRRSQRAQEQVLRTHHRWDQAVVDELRALGRDVPDPPPLYLPDAQ